MTVRLVRHKDFQVTEVPSDLVMVNVIINICVVINIGTGTPAPSSSVGEQLAWQPPPSLPFLFFHLNKH